MWFRFVALFWVVVFVGIAVADVADIGNLPERPTCGQWLTADSNAQKEWLEDQGLSLENPLEETAAFNPLNAACESAGGEAQASRFVGRAKKELAEHKTVTRELELSRCRDEIERLAREATDECRALVDRAAFLDSLP